MIVTLARLIGLVVATLALSATPPVSAADDDRWAAIETPIFTTYGRDVGLPNPVTTAIAESGDGFLWVGTEGGLARWDGYHFHVYRPRPGDDRALPDAWITALLTDRHGRLWIGTNGGGLARYDRDEDRFVTYGVGRGRLSDVHVTSLANDGSDGIWVGTEGGLDHVDPARDRITAFRRDSNRLGSLPDDRIVTIMRDRGGTLWIGTLSGLARTHDGHRFASVRLGEAGPPEVIGTLFEDDARRVWIGTQEDGAFRIDAEGAAPRRVRESSGSSHDWINAIEQADRDHVWLGTYGHGIVVVDTASGRTHRIARDRVVPQSLVNDSVWSLHRDRAGGMWVGTDGGLSAVTAGSTGAVSTVFGDTSNPRGLRGSDVKAVMAASNGDVWAGERTEGIDILDPLVGRIASVAADRTRPDRALPPAGVQSIVEWTPGTAYVGGMFGLYRIDASRRVTRIVVRGRDPIAQISAISRQAGALWISSRGNGIWTTTTPGAPGVPLRHIDAAVVDQRGTVFARGSGDDLWVGTRNGLERIDLRTRRVERIPPGSGSTALRTGYVCTLLLDARGRLWVGTADGIEILTGRVRGRPVFRRIGLEEGLPDADVDALLSDRTGRVWAATDNGIAVIDPATFAVRSLHLGDGVAISAYWSGSGARTNAGDLIFGGQGGLTIVRPERYRPWEYHPPIVVTEALVDGAPVAVTRFDGIGNHAATRPLVVDSGANSLSVEFAALDYSEPGRNRYAYRLDGFDRDWIPSDATKRLAAYTNLPPGDYTLRLRGSNREGAWSQTTLDMPIHVRPAWYQTVLFRIASCVAVVLGMAVVVRMRTRYLVRRQRELERQVETRTAELEESKRQIERVAYRDALTGLPNRRLFNEDVQHRVAAMERLGRPFALVLIDLDRFKQINDALGHDAGDALLVEASKRLRDSLRATDRLARIGGDEFAAILDDFAGDGHGHEREAIAAVCERIVDGFVEPVMFNGQAMKTSASVGVALAPEHGTHADAIFKASDLALYQAKRSGRNTWRWYAPGAIAIASADARDGGDAVETESGRTTLPR